MLKVTLRGPVVVVVVVQPDNVESGVPSRVTAPTHAVAPATDQLIENVAPALPVVAEGVRIIGLGVGALPGFWTVIGTEPVVEPAELLHVSFRT